jgi:hypothetical protein
MITKPKIKLITNKIVFKSDDEILGVQAVTLNIFFDLSICKKLLNFTICLVEFCVGINMQMY